MRAVAYDRVSTDKQGVSGLGQDAQRAQIDAYCAFKGWEIVHRASDVISSGKVRPGLTKAIALCEAGGADVLVAAKLSRLSRSTLETLALMERSAAKGWGMVALDVDIDTTTPGGRMVATMIAAINEYERRMIGERTKDALAALAAKGVKLGRPSQVTPSTRALVRVLAQKHGYRGAARILNDEDVPTPSGEGRWHPGAVHRIARAA